MSVVINEHRIYLSDHARLAAYSAAISQAVRPGDVVLDLGCGTGILGLLACRAGAARVYAIDATGMIEIARRLARDNGFTDRIVHLNTLSLDARLPEPVDVVMCDQMGCFGIDAGVVEYMTDARERFLRPGGTLIPQRLTLMVAPVEKTDLRPQVEFWNTAPAGFEFGSVRKWAVNNSYAAKFQTGQFLSEPVPGTTLDLLSASTHAFTFAVALHVQRSGTFEGIAGWFSAELAPGVTMSNSPLDADAIDRHAAFFPVDRPVPVRGGDVIDLELHIIPLEKVVTWKASVRRPLEGDAGQAVPVAAFVHSTFNGLLMAREHLLKTRPSFQPTLTRRGHARASALALCNGQRPLTEIEETLFETYQDVFPRRDQLSAFLSELVTRDTE